MKERIKYNHFLSKKILTYCFHTDWGIVFILMHTEGKGYCRVYSFDDDPYTWYISELIVNEEYRKQGVGTELINICFDICRRYNGQKVQLQVCDKAEQFIHDWYKRLGFEVFIHSKKECYSWLEKKL